MTPGDLANLAHLRRARDLMDWAYAQPLDVLTKGSLNAVIFTTSDLDIDQPYGVRESAFRDPSGNMIRLGQALG